MQIFTFEQAIEHCVHQTSDSGKMNVPKMATFVYRCFEDLFKIGWKVKADDKNGENCAEHLECQV